MPRAVRAGRDRIAQHRGRAASAASAASALNTPSACQARVVRAAIPVGSASAVRHILRGDPARYGATHMRGLRATLVERFRCAIPLIDRQSLSVWPRTPHCRRSASPQARFPHSSLSPSRTSDCSGSSGLRPCCSTARSCSGSTRQGRLRLPSSHGELAARPDAGPYGASPWACWLSWLGWDSGCSSTFQRGRRGGSEG